MTFRIAPGVTRLSEYLDLFLYRLQLTAPECADIQDHVDFLSAFAECVLCLGEFGFGGHGAQRKSYDSTDFCAGSGEFGSDQRTQKPFTQTLANP